MNSIKYIKGDLFQHINDDVTSRIVYLPHVCNNYGGWGAGFVIPLANIFPEAKEAYLSIKEYVLGQIQTVSINDFLFVVNMIAQNGFKSATNLVPLKYGALEECMKSVADMITREELPVEIHAPKFGAGLGGGDWKIISGMIKDFWLPISDVYIYEL